MKIPLRMYRVHSNVSLVLERSSSNLLGPPKVFCMLIASTATRGRKGGTFHSYLEGTKAWEIQVLSIQYVEGRHESSHNTSITKVYSSWSIRDVIDWFHVGQYRPKVKSSLQFVAYSVTKLIRRQRENISAITCATHTLSSSVRSLLNCSACSPYLGWK